MLRSLSEWADRVYKSRIGSSALLWEESAPSLGFSDGSNVSLAFSTDGTLQLENEIQAGRVRNLDGVLLKIALPDYWFYYRCMDTLQLPEKQSDVAGFLEWKLGQDLGLVQDGCAVALSGRGASNGRYAALLLDRNLLTQVEESVRRAGALLEELMPASFYAHQHIVANLQTFGLPEVPGVILVLFNGWWAMLLSDQCGNLIAFRSNPWWEGKSCSVQCEVVAQEVKRTLIGRSSEVNPMVVLVGDAGLTTVFQGVNSVKDIINPDQVSNHGCDSFTQCMLDMVLKFGQ